MTEVAFHFNAPDKLAYACRLLRKACASGSRVVVTGSPSLLREFDMALWTFLPLEFVPHCHVTADSRTLSRTPVVLAEDPASAPHRQVLVNLGNAVPTGFEGFERLIEVVGTPDQDRLAGRERWKLYADRGYPIVRHDVQESR